ncbi:MAG: type II toxin-antitoxin system VapB family antitoxin [Acidobacteriota bacterium]
MRTNLELDEELIKRAKRLTGLETEQAVVHEALRVLVRFREQEGVKPLRGKLRWEGSLDDQRNARSKPSD